MVTRVKRTLEVNGLYIDIVEDILRPLVLRDGFTLNLILDEYRPSIEDRADIKVHVSNVTKELGGLENIKTQLLEDITRQYYNDLGSNPLNSPC
jgi:hypothetical protein